MLKYGVKLLGPDMDGGFYLATYTRVGGEWEQYELLPVTAEESQGMYSTFIEDGYEDLGDYSRKET